MKYLLLLAAGLLLRAVSFSQGCSVNYVQPDFQLQKSDLSCLPNTGVIEAINQTGGVGPFTYKLVETNATNSTGLFNNLAAGLYTVEMRDACGTVRTRQVTLVSWSFSFAFTVDTIGGCSDGRINVHPTPASASYTYGFVKNGDTTWSASPTIYLKLYKQLTVLVKDACGNVQARVWNAPNGFLPYIKEIQHRLQCDKLDLFPVYYAFNNPTVCLYAYPSNALVACKTAPGNYTGGVLTNFFDIPWGQYYVIVQDACYRDSMYVPNMESSGGSELNPYNWDCSTFTMHVDGMEDTVCLYNAITNTLISCKGQDTVSINPRTGRPWPSGAVWDSLPYGCYYAWIYDPCTDSTFKIDSCVRYPLNVYMQAFPGCSLNQTTVQATFNPEAKKPYTVNVYNADWSLNSTAVTNNFDNYIGVNADSSGGMLNVIGIDACGHRDTTAVIPAVTRLSKSISIYNKCPGLAGTGGSGDVIVNATTLTNVVPVPEIIKKNTTDTSIAYSFHANDRYEFPNLPTGVYVMKFSFSSCSQTVVYDTVEIRDYEYPSQTPDTAIQCGGNQFTFTFPVTGGLTPYTFQIIGSTPTVPSLVSSVQSGPIFIVGNSQHYTSVKVRAIDRCGNSTIGDIAVVPINGCSILSVDPVRNDPTVKNKIASVYPNPAHGQFTISISQKKKTNYRIEIVNAAGGRFYEGMLYNTDRKDLTVNERFVPGLYLIKITDLQTGSTSVVKQIVN